MPTQLIEPTLTLTTSVHEKIPVWALLRNGTRRSVFKVVNNTVFVKVEQRFAQAQM